VGREGGLGWAATEQGREGYGPQHKLDILQIKELSFGLRFDIEFEFDSQTNSNYTHLNSK
jgi:hypothetical protein